MIENASGLRQVRYGDEGWGLEEPVEELHLVPEPAGFRLAYYAVVAGRYQTRHVDRVVVATDGWIECRTDGNPSVVRVRAVPDGTARQRPIADGHSTNQTDVTEANMPIDMRIWRIRDDRLEAVRTERLQSEESLENWLADDVSMVASDLLIIGRQLISPLGGILDLLAIDTNGDLAVLELKRDRTPRDVVAQALHYAAWVRTLSWEQVDQIATRHLGGASLAEAFQRKFGQPLPETINSSHRIYIVAAEMDPVSESIVRYLSEEYGANINVAFFRHFRDEDGDSYLGCSWLMEPTQVEDRGETSAPKRRSRLSFAELESLADGNGVGDIYRALFGFLSQHSGRTSRTQSNVAFLANFPEGRKALLSLYPGDMSAGSGLRADIRPDNMAAAFGVPETELRKVLPPQVESNWAYGEIRPFRDMDDVRRLLEVLGQGSVEEGGVDREDG